MEKKLVIKYVKRLELIIFQCFIMNDTLNLFVGTVLLYIKKLYIRTFRKHYITQYNTTLYNTIQHCTTLLRFYFMWIGVQVEVEVEIIHHTFRFSDRQKNSKIPCSTSSFTYLFQKSHKIEI
jgi:hypothetical protein